MKRSTAESHRILVVAYGDHCLSEAICKRWFQRSRDSDFGVRNEERGRSKICFKMSNCKSVLHRIVTGGDKRIYFKNPERKKSWVNPGEVSTWTAKLERLCSVFGRNRRWWRKVVFTSNAWHR